MIKRVGSGRPRKFKTVAAMRKGINAYFEECEQTGEPLTITQLALELDVTRAQLMKYEGYDDRFKNLIRAAKDIIINQVEIRGLTQGNVAGPIFWLKNHGWADKSEHEVSTPDGEGLKFNVNIVDPKK